MIYANSRKRLTNCTNVGACDVFERLVASPDTFISNTFNKSNSFYSLDSCSSIYYITQRQHFSLRDY